MSFRTAQNSIRNKLDNAPSEQKYMYECSANTSRTHLTGLRAPHEIRQHDERPIGNGPGAIGILGCIVASPDKGATQVHSPSPDKIPLNPRPRSGSQCCPSFLQKPTGSFVSIVARLPLMSLRPLSQRIAPRCLPSHNLHGSRFVIGPTLHLRRKAGEKDRREEAERQYTGP